MATVILLKSEIAADMFKEAGSSWVGVDDTHGLYVWDGTEDRYFRVDPAYIEGIIKGCYRLREEEEKRAATEKARELRRITNNLPEIRKRVFPLLFFVRQTTHPNS